MLGQLNRLALPVALIALSACASLPRGPAAARDPQNIITWQAIERMNVSTAHEVMIKRFNRPPAGPLRGSSTSFEGSQEPLVFIDSNVSEVAALRTLPARDIESMEILNAIEGTMRYGTGAVNGVIVIKTKRG